MHSEKVLKTLPEGFEENRIRSLLGLLSERIDIEEVRPTSRRMNSAVTGYGWSAVQEFVYNKHGRSVVLPKRLYLSPNCNTRQPTYLPLLHLVYVDLPPPRRHKLFLLQRQNRAGHSIRLVRDATLKPVTHSRLNNVAICHTDMSASLTAYVFPTLSLLTFFLSSVLSLFHCSIHAIHAIHSSYSFDLIFNFNCFHTFAFSQLLPLILFLFLHWMLFHVLYYLILLVLSFPFVFHLLLLFLRVLLINFLWF